jgi:hypothetical protein
MPLCFNNITERVDIVVTLNLYCEVHGLNLDQLTFSQG